MQGSSQNDKKAGNVFLPLTFFSEDTDENKSSKSAFTFNKGKILVDYELLDCINNIIKTSEKYCFIVTPFLESLSKWVNLGKLFDEIYDDGKKIFFILKKPSNEFNDARYKEDCEKIEIIKKEFNGKFDLFLVNYLHSKIYLNEKQVLITSINLKTFAIEKNHEIGCLIDDPDISKQIVNNIIIKKMLKDKDTEHTEGKWADWIINKIINGKTIDDNGSTSDESSIDENKNNNPNNNNDSSCESSSNKKSSNNVEHKINTPENLKLLTMDSLFIEILKKNNKDVEENYSNTKLLKQFSDQMKSKYTFDRKECWKSNVNILHRWIKVTQDMYEWALENIKL